MSKNMTLPSPLHGAETWARQKEIGIHWDDVGLTVSEGTLMDHRM
jgi:hypothetical protein